MADVITYKNKVDLVTDTTTAEEYKWNAADANQVKSAINNITNGVTGVGDANTVRGFYIHNASENGTPNYIPGFVGGGPGAMPMFQPSQMKVGKSATCDQISGLKSISFHEVAITPSNVNYFDVGKAPNEYVIPLTIDTDGLGVNGMQYAFNSVRIILSGNVNYRIVFKYLKITV